MINDIADSTSALLDKLAKVKDVQNENYTKDGILYCGKCNEPRQAWVDWIPDADGNREKKLVRVMCKCDVRRDEEEKERARRADFEVSMRSIRLALHTERKDVKWHFNQDDSPDSPISKTCRKYVEQWDEMKKNNEGILFYGRKGNGKSFYASCIYNALYEKGVLVGFTTTANLMDILGKWDKTEIINAIKTAHLLVLDDLGAERDTSYSAELMYSVIDTRYRSGLPTIVTTNIALANMEKEEEIWRSRIYDRIIEMCPIKLKLEGESRRSAIADERRKIARELLDWTKDDRSGGNGL